MIGRQLFSLALAVGLLAIHHPSVSDARSVSTRTSSTATDETGVEVVDTECVINIINAIINSINVFIDDLTVGLIPCQLLSCAPIPGTNIVFVLDCVACILSAIPFIGPIPENTCS